MRQAADVVVAGGGHNGLTCAALLARAGLDVVVLERRGRPGGAAATEELIPGYRFSTCAYALHLLHERVVDELELELDLLPSPTPLVALPDRDVVKMDNSGAATAGVADHWERMERFWDRTARAIDATLLGRPPSWDDVAAATGAGTTSLDELLGDADAEGRAFLAPAYFEGAWDEPGGPLAYAWMETSRCREERYQGVPRGGMATVADAFAAAARRAGARVECGVEVASADRGGVALRDGSRIEARAVAVGHAPHDTRAARSRAVKAHFALRGEPDLTLLGVDRDDVGIVLVRPDAETTVELQLPSLRDSSLAPRSCHTLSVFAPRGASGLIDAAARALPNVRDLVVGEVVFGPAELDDRIGLTGGQIHHLPHVPAAMFDRRGGARGDDGVYRCGAGAHPGGEISGVPGWNAAQAILSDLG